MTYYAKDQQPYLQQNKAIDASTQYSLRMAKYKRKIKTNLKRNNHHQVSIFLKPPPLYDLKRDALAALFATIQFWVDYYTNCQDYHLVAEIRRAQRAYLQEVFQ
jgi:hypothetical protein